jgi:hypothetical protein
MEHCFFSSSSQAMESMHVDILFIHFALECKQMKGKWKGFWLNGMILGID